MKISEKYNLKQNLLRRLLLTLPLPVSTLPSDWKPERNLCSLFSENFCGLPPLLPEKIISPEFQKSTPSPATSKAYPFFSDYFSQCDQASSMPLKVGERIAVSPIQESRPIALTRDSWELEELNIVSGSIPCVIKLAGRAAKRRNVYKSILRHMLYYIEKNREDILEILSRAGYSSECLDHAYMVIEDFNAKETQKGNRKDAQNVLKKAIERRSVYTILLRETLHAIMRNWSEGNFGRMYKKTLPAYREVCEKYYDETVHISGHTAEGRTYFI